MSGSGAAISFGATEVPERGVLRSIGIDGCVRLPLRVDAEALSAELARLPARTWGAADRDPVVQAFVESFFAIGHPRGPRPLPPEDRPPMAELPQLRRFLRATIPASPTRAIVARLAPGGFVPIHTDTPRFFRHTVRLSIQLEAETSRSLYCRGLWYELAPGEVWAIDNLSPHAVHNSGALPRLNVIADFLPSPELLALILAGEQGRGVKDDTARGAIETRTREHYRANRWRSIRYELFKLLWRRRA